MDVVSAVCVYLAATASISKSDFVSPDGHGKEDHFSVPQTDHLSSLLLKGLGPILSC